jgi:hypothetical protein
MKKIYNTYTKVVLLAVALIFVSCEDFVDVDPQNTLNAQDAYNTHDKVLGALNGAYNSTSSSSLLGGNLIFVPELLGADGKFTFNGTFDGPRQIINKQILTNNSTINGVFNAAYTAINNANIVLENLDVVNDTQRDRVRGEALFIRAYMHFELVRLFAKPYSDGNAATNNGVVIRTEARSFNGPDLADDCRPRNTVQEVYDLVITDLTAAADLVATSNGVYADKSTVNAILSRVYLQTGNYAGARDAANTAIQLSGNDLTFSYRLAFAQDNNSVEDVFAIQVSEIDGSNGMNLYWAPRSQGGRGDVRLTNGMIGFLNGTNRGYAINPDGTLNSDLTMVDAAGYTTKWYNQFGNVTTIRLAELLLTRAEANLEMGTSVGATPQADLDAVRSRVGLGSVAASVPAVFNERISELAFEGFYLHDLKRRQLTIEGYAYDANELVLPIPQNQINACPDTVQNDGY